MGDVASRFVEMARRRGDAVAIIRGGEKTTFRDLLQDVESLAAGLREAGVNPGDRAAVLAAPGRDFIVSVFALFRLGAVPVLIDPGIGFANMGHCLVEADPAVFLGSPKAQMARLIGRWAPSARLNVVVDGLWPTATSLHSLCGTPRSCQMPALAPESMAAILFTSGSTGAPKGAIYTHAMFAAQLDLLRAMFDIREGETSVATFPLFALFDVALGMTTVIPEMDFTRPGFVDPEKIIRPLQKYRAHQLFASPALLDRVGRYGEKYGVALPDLRRLMSAGAPVAAKILSRFSQMLDASVEIYTPYGATEALPVALIGSSEILGETAPKSAEGAGVCVGRIVAGVEATIIAIDDRAIEEWSPGLELPLGRIGEIVVKGTVVSSEYFRQPDATAMAKIRDGTGVRHRMGDLGYFDKQGRLWFCGRKAHRVTVAERPLYTVPVESVFNTHPAVRRTALVGVGGKAVLCVELEAGAEPGVVAAALRELGRRHPISRDVETFLFHPGFPVDIRHNAKIFREKLAVWAASELN